MSSRSGHFLVIEPFDVVQDERLAAAFRQPLDRAIEDPIRAIGVSRRAHRLERGIGVQRFGQLVHLRPPAPHVVEAVIERQPIEPGAERRIALEAPELRYDLQEDLLQQVLAIVRATRPSGTPACKSAPRAAGRCASNASVSPACVRATMSASAASALTVTP